MKSAEKQLLSMMQKIHHDHITQKRKGEIIRREVRRETKPVQQECRLFCNVADLYVFFGSFSLLFLEY